MDSFVYESTDPEVDLQQVNWVSVMKGGGTEIKTSLDKVWAMTKLMPEGRRGTERFWIKHAMYRVPPSLAFEYHRHIVNESMETQQKAASSTRAFAVQLAKARNTMLRRANISKGGFESSNEEKDEEKDEPPLSNAMHQKEWRDKGCSKCKLFGCPRGYDEANECDIVGTPTFERVQKIKAMERYMTKVNKYRQEEKKTALDYDDMQSSTHMWLWVRRRKSSWGSSITRGSSTTSNQIPRRLSRRLVQSTSTGTSLWTRPSEPARLAGKKRPVGKTGANSSIAMVTHSRCYAMGR